MITLRTPLIVFLVVVSKEWSTEAIHRIRANGDILYSDETRAHPRTLAQAERGCQAMSGTLPEIKTPIESLEYSEFVRSPDKPNIIPHEFWLNARYEGNGVYKWNSDGSQVNFGIIPIDKNQCTDEQCCQVAYKTQNNQVNTYNCNSNMNLTDLVCVLPTGTEQQKKIDSLNSAKTGLIATASVLLVVVVILILAVVVIFGKLKKMDPERQPLTQSESHE